MEPFHQIPQSQEQNGQNSFPFQLMYQPEFSSQPSLLQSELQPYMFHASSPLLSVPSDQSQFSSQFMIMESQCHSQSQLQFQTHQHAQSQSQPIKKGTSNKIWKPHYVDFLISFLVEQTKQGMKIDKTFKKQAFEAAATAVNNRFNESFTWENVDNHMRTLKTRYQEIKKCRDLWGAGWNDDVKMITLDKATYETYIESNPKAKDYINKPIENYEALKIICGDEQAMGSYKKSIFQQFGTRQQTAASKTIDTVDLGKEQISLDEEMEAPTVGLRRPKKQRGSTQASPQDTTSSGRKCRASAKRPRENIQTVITKLARRVDDVSKSMSNAQPTDWAGELYEKIMELDGFETTVKEAAFDTLREDEADARAFIVKNMMMRISWMKRFMAQRHSG